MLGGMGGQGIRLASQILAQAAGFEGKRAYQNNIYGQGVRGAAIYATVVIATEEVLSPVRDEPWGAIAMDQRHATWFGGIVQAGGIMVANSTLASELPERPDVSLMPIPATATAEQDLGNVMLATMLALGAFVEASGIVRVESLIEALPDMLPPHRQALIEANGDAIRAGVEIARPLVAERRDYNLALKGG